MSAGLSNLSLFIFILNFNTHQSAVVQTALAVCAFREFSGVMEFLQLLNSCTDDSASPTPPFPALANQYTASGRVLIFLFLVSVLEEYTAPGNHGDILV